MMTPVVAPSRRWSLAAELTPEGRRRQHVGLTLLLIIVTALVAYWPTVENGFVQWDEPNYVTENPLLTDPEGLSKVWTTVKNTERQYYPLLVTNYWLQYRFWGENPVGYHAVNLLFHVCNSVLVFYLIRALGAAG